MSLNKVIALVLLLLLGLSGWWLAQQIVVSYEDRRHPPAYEIRNNPLAALEQLLLKRGQAVSSHTDRQPLTELPPASDTILLRDLSQPLLNDQQQRLLSWVRAGGHLVYEVNQNLLYSHSPPDDTDTPDNNTLWRQLGVDAQHPEERVYAGLHAQFSQAGESGYVRLESDHILTTEDDSAQAILTSELGVHCYRLSVGQGQVTLLTDSRFMDTPRVWLTNQEFSIDYYSTGLNQHDAASFALLLLQQRDGNTWLIHDTGSISLLQLIYRDFPLTSSLVSLWLVLFFMYLLRHLGPRHSEESSNQQNLQQHLTQAGLFHWRRDKGHFLLNSWRQRLIRRLQQRQPQLAGCEPQRMAEILAKQCQHSKAQILQALTGYSTTQTDLMIQVQVLKTLWKM